MTNNLKSVIDGRIKTIRNASKSLFIQIGNVSRELLMYVPDSKDIGAVNRLLGALNPHDRANMTLFFVNFLPWKFDDKANMFAGMINGTQRIANMAVEREAFLKLIIKNDDGTEREATFWDWAKENISPATRTIDYNNNIVSLVKRATADKNADGTDNKFKITHEQVLTSVLNTGISLDELMAFVTKAEAVRKAETVAANDVAPVKTKRERKPKTVEANVIPLA